MKINELVTKIFGTKYTRNLENIQVLYLYILMPINFLKKLVYLQLSKLLVIFVDIRTEKKNIKYNLSINICVSA